MNPKKARRALLTVGFVLGTFAIAQASRSFLTSFTSTYSGTSSSQLNSCVLCHINPAGGGARNAYGEAYRSASHSFSAIEGADSDGDGWTNLQEINALTFPGDAASRPPGTPPAADTTRPTVTAFSLPATATSLTVGITLTANDNVGVTGYMITTTSATPAATAGWLASPPTSYTFASDGSQTLYAWARDAAGNISASRSASTSISLPVGSDTARPTVTAFVISPTSNSLTVTISTFTASDDVAVTGYLATASSTAPSAGAAGWTSTRPTSFTFSAAGAQVLYGWAKDAAGNVSASRSASTTITLPAPPPSSKSINSTSQNRSAPQATQVAEQAFVQTSGYQILAANDLGMHCADLDQRVASILPPFNVLHAQVVQKGHLPRILGPTQVEVVYSAASNPLDPAQANPIPASVYKSNFWDMNPRTGHPLAFDAFDAYYPPGILSLFALLRDIGLPVPDLQQLYLGNGTLAADQQAMPSKAGQNSTSPYSANAPQRFALYYQSFPFFINFPFGYTQSGTNWFSAEGIPLSPFDDMGRDNPYPLMRVQARAISGNTLNLSAGSVIASLDAVTPVSGEVDCRNCHTSSRDGGNGIATDGYGFAVASRFDDPKFGQVPEAVSIEYAFDTNILRLHDFKHHTNLQNQTPVSCQRCHYTPALDLAHLGPMDVNGRQQSNHQSFSRVMHSFHGNLGLFPEMPSPAGRTVAVRDSVLTQTCYQCHPGRTTQCFRGEMANAGQACQDCHGNMNQVGNDFSVNAASGGGFALAGDYYTNSRTLRVPWANEPMCQSCHTGDVNRNLASSTNVVKSPDGLRLMQAYRAGDDNAKPIVAVNRRFAENQSASGGTAKQVLYRLSRGHGGIFCEGCHGSTHAEWPNEDPNANDNVAAKQLQGHEGKIVECSTCHGNNTFTESDFRGNFDANGWMKGPHGMHPVDRNWIRDHNDVFSDSRTPRGTCQACHGARLQGSPLARAAVDRTFRADDRTVVIRKGAQVSCTLCHGNPLNRDRDDDN